MWVIDGLRSNRGKEKLYRFTAKPLVKRERDPRKYFRNREGWIAPGFKDENVLPDLTNETVRFIEERAGAEQPFLLYFPVNSPHTLVVPVEEFKNTSGTGEYGDFVRQTDGVVGRILETIENCGIAENTLFIVTSDNGAETITFALREEYGHHSSAHLKGMKRDLWDGGHRMPFLAWWKGRIQSGSVCSESICLTDLLATCAELANLEMPVDAGEDSFSFLPLLLGEKERKQERAAIVHHSFQGDLAIRLGKWKYIDGKGSGGNRYDFPEWQQKDEFPGQLYNMEEDEAERENLYGEYPGIVRELKDLLEKFKIEGRSRPIHV